MTHTETALYHAISTEPIHVDKLRALVNADEGDFYMGIFDLQAKKLVDELPGRLFVRHVEPSMRKVKKKTYEELAEENRIFRSMVAQVYQQTQFALEHNHGIYTQPDGRSMVYFSLYFEEVNEAFQTLTKLQQ